MLLYKKGVGQQLKWLLMVFILQTPFVVHGAESMDAHTILQRLDEQLWPKSAEFYAQLVHQQPKGEVNRLIYYGARTRPNHWAILFVGPDDWKGRTLMRRGLDMWLRIPGEVELHKLVLRQSLTEGLLSNGDIFHGDFANDFYGEIMEETDKHWLILLRPQESVGNYSYVELKVWRADMLPVEARYFAKEGNLLKVVYYKEVRKFAGQWNRPSLLVAENPVNLGYQTQWRLGSLKERTFPPETFSKEFLPRIGTLLK